MLELETAADFACDHGFGMAQVSLDISRYFPENFEPSRREEVKSYFESKNVALCLHGPSDLPLMNRHRSVRDAAVERLLEMTELAIDLGARHFVFHPGRLAFYSPGQKKVIFMERRYPEKHVEYFVSSIRKILRRTGGRINLCIENTGDTPYPILNSISKLVREEGLYLAWDIGHIELSRPDVRSRMLKYYTDNARYIRLVHLHDVTERGDHKALGSGKIDIFAYLEIINTIGADVILEVFPKNELLKSIKYINEETDILKSRT